MRRAQLLQQLQQHPLNPDMMQALADHELAAAAKYEAQGDRLRAQVHFGRATTWDERRARLVATLHETEQPTRVQIREAVSA